MFLIISTYAKRSSFVLTNIHKDRKKKPQRLLKPSCHFFKVVATTGMRIKDNLKLQTYPMRSFSDRESLSMCSEPSTVLGAGALWQKLMFP